ncbi:MAG: leucine-rich repeat domain-containing protein [Saprospiraceae bacterium]|nr:leucine-rich repeat domain-containing protein [Saprospiraceae bacterium]
MTANDSYLESDAEGAYTAQMTRLLRDAETDNCPLLLELMEGGGVNRRLLGYLFGIAVFHPIREVSARALGLLQRHAAPETVRQAQKLRESAAYHYDEAEYFSRYQSAEIDLFDLLLASKMCLWHRNRPGRGSNTLAAHQTLDLRRLAVNHLSPALATLDFLKLVALPAHKDFDLAAAIPLLLQLPLEILIIENIRVDSFPVELLALPRLTTFILRRGTYRPRVPMQVPEGGPYGHPGLEKLIIEGYPLCGEEWLGPFPRLREATLLRCNLSRLDFLEQSQQLERLNVKFNQLETLPAFLSGCTELRSLELSGNPFRKIELDLEPLRNLEELDLKMQTRLPGNFRLNGK